MSFHPEEMPGWNEACACPYCGCGNVNYMGNTKTEFGVACCYDVTEGECEDCKRKVMIVDAIETTTIGCYEGEGETIEDEWTSYGSLVKAVRNMVADWMSECEGDMNEDLFNDRLEAVMNHIQEDIWHDREKIIADADRKCIARGCEEESDEE